MNDPKITTGEAPAQAAHDESCFLAMGGGGECNCSLSKEPAPKGTITVEQILLDFKTNVAGVLAEALNDAYGKFVNDCDVWTREDVEVNTAHHAREAIRAMLAGEDPAFVVSSIKTYAFPQLNTIRDLILARHGDELVRKALSAKDEEIMDLKRQRAEAWGRR